MQLYSDFQTRCRQYVNRIQTHPQYITAKSKNRLGSTWHKPHGVYVSEQWRYYGDKLGICPLLQQAERVISCRPSHCIQHKIEPADTRTVWVKIMEGGGWSCKNIQVNIHTRSGSDSSNDNWIGTNLTGTAFSFAYYNITSLGFVHSQNLKRTKYVLALHTVCTFKFSSTTIHITMSYWRMEIILVQFIFTLFDASKKRKTDSLLLFLLWGITFCHSNLYRKAVTYTKSHQAVWCTSWAPQASARTEDNSNHNFNKCFIRNCSQPIINYISRRKSGQFSVSVHRPVVHHSVGSQWANKLHSISATCNRHICTPCLQQLKPNQTVWQA